MRNKKLTLFLSALLLSLVVFAQSAEKNSALDKLNELYNQHIGYSAILYSGPSYIHQNYPMNGTPFFASDTLSPGWVSYDGHFYNNILLQWDVLQNYVLTYSPAQNGKLVLRNELIDSFYFAGHLIKFLPQDKKSNLMKGGLYDILYKGPTTYIVSRKKSLNTNMEKKNLLNVFDKNSYYIKKNGIYYLVKNKKDITDLFPKDISTIKKEVRRNELRWKKDLEQILMIAVVQYDKLHPVK